MGVRVVGENRSAEGLGGSHTGHCLCAGFWRGIHDLLRREWSLRPTSRIEHDVLPSSERNLCILRYQQVRRSGSALNLLDAVFAADIVAGIVGVVRGANNLGGIGQACDPTAAIPNVPIVR